jgi:iron complex transport system substrate-binding protein
MNQRDRWRGLVIIFALAGLAAGCDRKRAGPAAVAKAPTVASLVPAATDLLVGMGCRDHLVAVSNFDTGSQTADLPRVGDYQNTDWEKLSRLRPNVIVTQFDAGHVPGGFTEQCARLGATQLNLHIERLPDIDAALVTLGTACGEPEKAAAEVRRIRQSLDDVRSAVAGRPRVRTLIVVGATGLDLAGRDTFLDDLLNVAGGENATNSARYVTLDREALAALKPEAILQLLPGADARTLEQAAAFWETFPELPAVKEHRVWQLTQTFIMQPGSHVAESATIFAQKLHPQARIPATTQVSP